MKKRLVLFSAVLAVAGLFAAITAFSPTASAAGQKTGVGLSEHVLMAYRQGWKYQPAYYGQFLNGTRASDCSGLIKSYLWWTGSGTNPRPSIGVAGSSSGMLSSASAKGTINYSDSSSLPRIHGLILYEPGHVGVYVGNNMAVDNRCTGVNMKYEPVFGRSRIKWRIWMKLPQITYPTTGLVTFNGQLFYYENGQYVVSTTRTVDGKQYTFGASGASTSSAPAAAVEQNVAASAPQKSAAPVTKSPAKPAASKSSSSTSPAKPAATKSSSDASDAKSAASYTDLGINVKSGAVKALQQRLKDLGYYYELVNTYYDQMVADAVKTYQAAAKLPVTGKADAATQKSLFASSAPENPDAGTLKPGIHSSLVKNMQARLIALGYMSGKTTVTYDDATKDAVAAYQQAAGLEPNGIMTQEALDQLYADNAVRAAAVSSAPASSASSSVSSSASSAASQSTARIYDDAILKANAATAETVKEAKPESNSGMGIAIFFVCASALFTGAFMLTKKIRRVGFAETVLWFKKIKIGKPALHIGAHKK